MPTDQTRASYNRQAADYDRRWEAYLEHTHREFLLRVVVHEDETVLDSSSGTGLLARALIERGAPFGKLVLNEPSEEMAAIGQSRIGIRSNVTMTAYPADQLYRLEDKFDLILCLNSYHHYRNQEKVLDLFQQLLKPGGRICILDWNRIGLFRPVNAIIRRFADEHIDTKNDREMKQMIRRAGFTVKTDNSWAYRYWRFYFFEAKK